jgi:hypothetical protein
MWLRRVQEAIWPIISPSISDFSASSSPGSYEGRLSSSAVVDISSAQLLSGSVAEIIQWQCATCSDEVQFWSSLWLACAPFATLSEMVTVLCDCMEYGLDSLPDWVNCPYKLYVGVTDFVQRNAAKIVYMGQMDRGLLEQQVPGSLWERMSGLLAIIEARTDGDEVLSKLAACFSSGTYAGGSPTKDTIDQFVEPWKSAIDEVLFSFYFFAFFFFFF